METNKIIRPRTVFTYDQRDVLSITGLEPVFDHKRVDFSTLNVWVDYFRNKDGKRVEKTEARDMVFKYMKDHGIIPTESKPAVGFTADYYWGDGEDDDGNRGCIKSMEMRISIFR